MKKSINRQLSTCLERALTCCITRTHIHTWAGESVLFSCAHAMPCHAMPLVQPPVPPSTTIDSDYCFHPALHSHSHSHSIFPIPYSQGQQLKDSQPAGTVSDIPRPPVPCPPSPSTLNLLIPIDLPDPCYPPASPTASLPGSV